MMALQCPTGGLYNILRFAKSVVGMLFQEFQSLWEEDEMSVSWGDKMEKMTKTNENPAKNITTWVVGGSNLVGILFQEFQSLREEDKKSANRGDKRGKMTNNDEKREKDIILWVVDDNNLVFSSEMKPFQLRQTIRLASPCSCLGWTRGSTGGICWSRPGIPS